MPKINNNYFETRVVNLEEDMLNTEPFSELLEGEFRNIQLKKEKRI